MGKKVVTSLQILLITLILSVFTSGKIAHAANIVTFPVTGTYEQKSARKMLDSINTFRTGPDAWYWNENNTNKVVCKNLGKLSYDYKLEEAAMQRAMEIAVYYSHTRPNGELCFTAYPGKGGYVGENIAYGFDTADEVFEAWQETRQKYEGQGHRRNMLSSNYTHVAIGHVIIDDIHYWVQEFRSAPFSTVATPVFNGAKTISVDFLASNIKHKASPKYISLKFGDSYDLSNVQDIVYYDDGIHYSEYANYAILSRPASGFSVADKSALAIENNKLIAKKAGNAYLYVVCADGGRASIPVYVRPISIYLAACSSIPTQTETGSAITPDVTLKYNGVVLTLGQDYTVEYSNNVKPGYAKVTITGKGNFTGTTSTSFYIKKSSAAKKSKDDNEKTKSQSASKVQASSDNQNSPVSLKKISSLKLSKGKKSMTVSWDKMSGASGYEIQYATNKKFTGAKIKSCSKSKGSVKIKKLKSGKKYYVRIRYYHRDNGSKKYSKWSKTKSIKL